MVVERIFFFGGAVYWTSAPDSALREELQMDGLLINAASAVLGEKIKC